MWATISRRRTLCRTVPLAPVHLLPVPHGTIPYLMAHVDNNQAVVHHSASAPSLDGQPPHGGCSGNGLSGALNGVGVVDVHMGAVDNNSLMERLRLQDECAARS